jgi:sugar phosphate isomerase/epimerase
MQLSLAGWSLNRLFTSPVAPLSLVDFPAFTRDTFGIHAVELNNIYFASTEPAYLDELSAAAARAGSTLLNIAVDEPGDLASTDEGVRRGSIERYVRWIPIARQIGCTAIRANSGGKEVTDREAAIAACTDSFQRLAEVGRREDVTILVENHWGISADPDVMVRLTQAVRATHGDAAMATLADFGNWPDDVDRYAALRKVMPLAGAVHAKVNEIDEQLNHPRFDHARCIRIARDAGYDGHLGIEYEGSDEPVEGIRRGATLLRRLLA